MSFNAASGRRKVAAAVCAGLFGACAAPALAQQITIKIAHPTIKASMDHWAFTFKQGIEKRAPGRVKVDVFPGGQLGTQPATISGVQLGTIEMSQMPSESLSGVDQRVDAFNAPGLFEDISHAHRAVHDPQFKKAVWPILDARNLHVVGFACETMSEYVTVEPVRALSEFKGKKIRVLGSRIEVEIVRRLGATGVPMQLSEALPGLQQKAIDGVRGGMPIFVPFKFATVAPNLTRTGEAPICVPKFVSKLWFDKLPADIRTMVAEEAAKADEANIAWNVENLKKLYAAWTQQKGVTHELSPSDKAQLRKRLQSVGDDVFKDQPQVKATYEALKAAAARTRK